MSRFVRAIHRFFAQMRPTRMRLRKRYKQAFGVYPDLRNPKTFNEKLQWRKLHERDPLMRICADKYAVRDHVRSKLGEDVLVPLLAVVDRPEAIPWEALPNRFVIKATHGSGWLHIVNDKRRCNREMIVADCRRWLESNYYDSLREWQYKSIPPRLIVEQLLLTPEGGFPEDYKVHCFRRKEGTVMLVQVNVDRFGHHRACIYDRDWRKMPFTIHLDPFEGELPRPSRLDELLRVADTLSEDFSCVRVDLFHIEGKVYFGELTFNRGSGLQPFRPAEWDRVLGDYWELPPRERWT